jgi:hypothetical protein
MPQVSRFNTDKMLTIGVLLHLIVGWTLIKSIEGQLYLVIGTFTVLFNLISYTLHRPLWRFSIPYFRFFRLMSLVSCTMYLQAYFPSALIPILHMIAVIVVSAFYLMPLLIWFISGCYGACFLIYFYIQHTYEMDLSIIPLTVAFILIIVIALHKI